MTTEERLAEIRARVDDLRQSFMADDMHYFHCERVAMEDVPWLLDLVEADGKRLVELLKLNGGLVERVRELEAELANSIKVIHSGPAAFRSVTPLEVEVDPHDLGSEIG